MRATMPMLTEGKKAPAFSLESSEGKKVALKDLAGGYAVIYFYPRDSTPGCTVEAEGFRDAMPKFKKKGVKVFGVSKDSIASHQKFCDKYGLTFPLLSDPDGAMIEAYGAWGEKNMYGKKMMGIIRSTVIVGPDGKVFKVFPKVKPPGHAEEVLAALP
jgi:peroxiredoxin Q/BCP